MDPHSTHLRQSLLICTICQDTFKDPRVLPCLHTFCIVCIQHLPKPEFWCVECPQCKVTVKLPKDGVDGLSPNFFTNKMLNFLNIQLRDEHMLQCSNCELGHAAVSRCINCSEFLCVECTQAHRITRLTRTHNISEIEHDDISENGDIQRLLDDPVTCSCLGKEEVKYFCATCNEVVCGDCIIIKHREHEFGNLKELVSNHRAEIAVMVTQTKRKTEPFRNAIKEITELQNSVKTNATKVRNEVRNYIAACVRNLQEYEYKLLSEVDLIEKTKLENLTDQEYELSLANKGLTVGCHFAEQALQQGSEVEVMTLKKQITQQLDKLIATDMELNPCDNDVILYKVNKDAFKKHANRHYGLGEIHTVKTN